MKTVCIVTGTRADWGILSPLARTLHADPAVDVRIMATNMHLLDTYGHTADEIEKDGFAIDARVDVADTFGGGALSRAAVMADCLRGCAEAFLRMRPDAAIILGDRFEMLAAASAAAITGVPIIHISGGETTGGAIDDRLRHAITQLASLHLVSARQHGEKVAAMTGTAANIVNTGSLGVWNMLNQPFPSRDELAVSLGFDPATPFAVATFHPATLDTVARPADRCRAMLDALDSFAYIHVIVTYPNNDTGSEEIIDLIEGWASKNPSRVTIVKSLGLSRYLGAVREAEFVIGNSSSGVIEVPSTGTPAINIGSRQQGRLHGPGVIDCDDDADSIARAIERAMSPEFREIASKRENPYFQPDTLAKSVDAIKKFLNAQSQ